VEIELPMSLRIAPAPDNRLEQAAMFGPLVLAARMGYDDLDDLWRIGSQGTRRQPTDARGQWR
jgi:hypothetical protein